MAKIAIYKDNLSTGRGADKAVKNLSEGLAERGHDVELFEKAALASQIEKNFDVFIATGSNEAVDIHRLGYLDRKDRAKTILQLHLFPRGFFKWKHPVRNWRIRRAFNKFDCVQVLCRSYEDEFHRLAPCPRVETIGNYTEMAGAEANGSCTILYPAAAINKVKNQQLLIRAFALLADEFPDWNVRLLGRCDTRYAENCRQLIGHLGMQTRISMVGFSDNLRSEYAKSAFIAFPSILEGFPLAILEAAGFGLPAVAISSLQGVNDIIKDGETGSIVVPTTKSYAAGLRRLMADEDLRRQMGARAKTYCAEHYSREKILDQWEALLKSVIGNGYKTEL